MNKGKSSTSSRHGSRRRAKNAYTTRPFDPSEPITEKQRKDLRAGFQRGLRREDLEEIPEVNFAKVRRVFLRGFPAANAAPDRKRQLTIRLDADVFDWLRGLGKGYQTKLNALLREAMMASRPRQ